MSSRELMRAARAWADQQTQRVADLPSNRALIVSVASLAPLTVSWRTGTYPVAGTCAAYTPAIGDRVLCLLVDSQLVVIDRLV